MLRLGVALGAAVIALGVSGCGLHLAQTAPPPMRPLKDVAREERGEVLNVRDTKLDLSTGRGAPVGMRAPLGVGPIGIGVPVTLGGEKKKEVPAEEITVQLASGRLVGIVQELSSPPFAPGERVKVQFEAVDEPGTIPRMRVVRE